MTGRRRARRFSLKLAAKVLFGPDRQELAAELKDISEGGALVLVDVPIEFGAIVRVMFELEPDRQCQAMGRVLRQMSFDGRRGIAVEFAHTSLELMSFLHDLDAAFARRGDSFLDYIRNVTIEIAC